MRPKSARTDGGATVASMRQGGATQRRPPSPFELRGIMRGVTDCDIAAVTFIRRTGMCRSIKTLHNFKPPATEEEVRASSLQFVRKLSGFSKPSRANEAAFTRAVDDVAQAARALLDALVTNAPPRDREVEASKARAKAAGRF